jgi:transposase-like protein
VRRAGWRELLVDIKQRGPEIAPDLAVGDGALGFWKAIEEVFPGTRHQRCWVHKTANVLNKVALSVQVNMKADLREIYGAPTRAVAEAAIDVFADKYGAKYEKAVACLTKDREALLAFFDFLAEHWDHLLHQTRSRACSRRCGIEPCGQREPCRPRPPSSWCSNWSMPLRKRGDD